MFQPHKAGEHGEGLPPEGKERVMLYAACKDHDMNNRMVLIQIEQAIVERMGGS